MRPSASAPDALHKHTVSGRFAATLGTNVVRMGLSFATGMILARSLGPEGYGDYNFLLATFLSLRSLIDMGSSSAFYTFIAQFKRSLRFYRHYAFWLTFQAVAVLMVVGWALPRTWIANLWVGHDRSWVLLAFGAIFLSTAVWKTAESIGEARRETIWIQKIRLAIAIAHFLLVGAGYVQQALNVPLVFLLVIIEHAAATLWCLWRLDWGEALAEDEAALAAGATFRLYADFCKPLVLCSLTAFLGDYASRWLLQFYAGSAQQGFFSIGQQFTAISLLGATSLINIFWKEIAAAHGEGNRDRLRELYSKTTQLLFFAAAAVSCCAIPFSREIILCCLGPEYSAAWLSFTILLLFPVLQTLGQLNGSYFLAAHQTQKYFAFTFLATALGTLLCYILVAPQDSRIPGFGMGAFGLAVSHVITQFLVINLEGWIISRSIGLRWPLLRQLGMIAILLVVAFACRGLAAGLIPSAQSVYAMLGRMALAGILYLAAIAALLYKCQSLTGIDIAWVRDKFKC